jgi:hypothetical protein
MTFDVVNISNMMAAYVLPSLIMVRGVLKCFCVLELILSEEDETA